MGNIDTLDSGRAILLISLDTLPSAKGVIDLFFDRFQPFRVHKNSPLHKYFLATLSDFNELHRKNLCQILI